MPQIVHLGTRQCSNRDEPETWKVHEFILEEIEVRDGAILASGNPNISLALPASTEPILRKFIGRLVTILRTTDEILIGAKLLPEGDKKMRTGGGR